MPHGHALLKRELHLQINPAVRGLRAEWTAIPGEGNRFAEARGALRTQDANRWRKVLVIENITT
jgi:hypothetical protein